MKIVFVTGMSGAGRSTAARALEDEGYYVMDNLPPKLLIPAIESLAEKVPKVAVVLDVRGGSIAGIAQAIADLKMTQPKSSTLFLDAADPDLVHRFEGSRRAHPLQKASGLLTAINSERIGLQEIRADADLVIDTTGLTPHDLKKRIYAAFGTDGSAKISLNLVSFGFKRGAPIDADLIFDARFLPNPHWEPALKSLDGRNQSVRDFVFGDKLAGDYLNAIKGVLNIVIKAYRSEAKRYLTVAIGCTGGKHRSVALIEELAKDIKQPDVEINIQHRDCELE